jgi:hypothetical protein
MKAYWGMEALLHTLLTMALDGSSQLHAPATLPPSKKAPGTHWTGGWVGPTAGLGTVVKRKISSPCWELNPRTPITQLVV